MPERLLRVLSAERGEREKLPPRVLAARWEASCAPREQPWHQGLLWAKATTKPTGWLHIPSATNERYEINGNSARLSLYLTGGT